MTMRLQLSAPYPAATSYIYLPAPSFGDAQQMVRGVDVFEAETGMIRTYVSDTADYQLIYVIDQVGRSKMDEVLMFYRHHNADKVLLTDHNGVRWVVVFDGNDQGMSTTTRSAPCEPLVSDEEGTLSLSFIGRPL